MDWEQVTDYTQLLVGLRACRLPEVADCPAHGTSVLTYRQKIPFNAACIFCFLRGHGGWGGGGLTDFDCLRRLTQVDKSAGHQLDTPTDFPTTFSLLASGCLPIIR